MRLSRETRVLRLERKRRLELRTKGLDLAFGSIETAVQGSKLLPRRLQILLQIFFGASLARASESNRRNRNLLCARHATLELRHILVGSLARQSFIPQFSLQSVLAVFRGSLSFLEIFCFATSAIQLVFKAADLRLSSCKRKAVFGSAHGL